MIILYDDTGKHIDARHTVDIRNSITFASAIQITEDNKYESVIYMSDDSRTFMNTAIIDATDEELEQYRKYCKNFRPGDIVKITKGRKMLNEIKTVKNNFKYVVPNTYGKAYVNYLVFTDGTKVNKLYCDFV